MSTLELIIQLISMLFTLFDVLLDRQFVPEKGFFFFSTTLFLEILKPFAEPPRDRKTDADIKHQCRDVCHINLMYTCLLYLFKTCLQTLCGYKVLTYTCLLYKVYVQMFTLSILRVSVNMFTLRSESFTLYCRVPHRNLSLRFKN